MICWYSSWRYLPARQPCLGTAIFRQCCRAKTIVNGVWETGVRDSHNTESQKVAWHLAVQVVLASPVVPKGNRMSPIPLMVSLGFQSWSRSYLESSHLLNSLVWTSFSSFFQATKEIGFQSRRYTIIQDITGLMYMILHAQSKEESFTTRGTSTGKFPGLGCATSKTVKSWPCF